MANNIVNKEHSIYFTTGGLIHHKQLNTASSRTNHITKSRINKIQHSTGQLIRIMTYNHKTYTIPKMEPGLNLTRDVIRHRDH